jgi:hypothetical protein
VANLTTATMKALSTDQVRAIETRDIAVLTSQQLGNLTTTTVAALSTDQVVALSTYQVNTLSTASFKALSTDQVRALETADVAVLSSAQMVALTTSQAAAFSTAQVEALQTAQIQSLNTAAYAVLDRSTPIILDLNGDGVRTLSISDGVKFDIFGDGQSVNTGWVSSGDGLLVLDRNHDGTINDGSELFGSSTKLVSGEKAPDGYAALRELDTNHDGVISNADAAYADLRVWVDSNSDGVSGVSENKTLESLGISKINLTAAVGTGTDNGNILGLTSSYETSDGATHAAADVWFAADKAGANAKAGTLDAAIAALNMGETPLASQSDAGAAPMEHEVAPLVLVGAMSAPVLQDDLRTRVSGLAQAIGSFGDSNGVQDVVTGLRMDTAVSSIASTNAVASLAVVSMVDVMKQFDSNGNLLTQSTNTGVASIKPLSLSGLQDTANQGILTTGGKT